MGQGAFVEMVLEGSPAEAKLQENDQIVEATLISILAICSGQFTGSMVALFNFRSSLADAFDHSRFGTHLMIILSYI